MNIVGLNKLPIAPQPTKAQSGAASKEGSAFADVLGGQSQTDERVTFAGSRGQAPEPSSLPSQPNTPVMESPTFADRVIPTPNEIPLVNPTAKPEVTIAKDDEGVDSLTRRAVWSSFLRKMKEELGVSAEDVLGAFDSLSAEELSKPPRETVDKIVLALGLSPDQTQVAKRLFLDLINRTQARSIGEELTQSEKQISLTLMSQRELDRKTQNKAIDNLNQNFFMKGPYERSAPMAPAAPAAGAAVPIKEDASPAPFMPQNPSARMTNSETAVTLPKEFQPAQTARPLSAEKKVDIDSLIKKFTEGQGQSSQVKPQEPAESLATFTAPATPAMAPAAPEVQAASTPVDTAARMMATPDVQNEAVAALNAIFGGGNLNDQADGDLGEDASFTSDASYLATGLGGEGRTVGLNGSTDFQQQLTKMDTNQPMAVPDLVKNAQVMVRDGGGEMKVTLTPEGLGEVAMKVSVKEGKVNVQMITESDEAKRLIERSLGDLKSQLAQNQLQVMDIKIDTATNLGKQLEQQFNDAQRQMAQQSLEQFRQDHQGWRRSFFEVPGAKVYKNQSEAARDIQAPTSVASRNRGGSRRLDLVA